MDEYWGTELVQGLKAWRLDEKDRKKELEEAELELEKVEEDPLDEHVAVPNHIFFIHFNDHINYRYMCAIESASIRNPESNIIVFAKNVKNFKKEWPEYRLYQVAVKPINYDIMFSGTPLEDWYVNKNYTKSHWVDQNLGNALRLAVLYKIGGTYLDMDTFQLSSMKDLGPSVTIQRWGEDESINNAFLRFEPRNAFVWGVMEQFVKKFDGYGWGMNGPIRFTRTYEEGCKKGEFGDENFKNACKRLTVLPVEAFQMLYPDQLLSEFKYQCNLLKDVVSRSYGVHWWNKNIGGEKTWGRDLVISYLMQASCPRTSVKYIV